MLASALCNILDSHVHETGRGNRGDVGEGLDDGNRVVGLAAGEDSNLSLSTGCGYK